MTRTRVLSLYAAAVLVVATASIAIGLLVTPMQQVSTTGQTVQVGVAAPTFSLSGPGQLDLFGQHVDTSIQFVGPVRPKLTLTSITLSKQLSELAGGRDPAHDLEAALVSGWEHYFFWQVVIVGASALLLLGALAGWLRRGRRTTVLLIATGLVVTEAINLGAIMVTAYTTPDKLSRVSSLQALVGSTPLQPTPPATSTPPATDSGARRKVVVIGDSTAAGLGNAALPQPTADDRSCKRSIDAYAVDLAHATDWQVTNLACSGATIRAGLLGPQTADSRTLPAQLDAKSVRQADLVIVSIGANDVHWTDILRVCAVSKNCRNKAELAFFQQALASFSRDYLQLLSRLQLLPKDPKVLINNYYNPFVGDIGCLSNLITADKRAAMVADLDALNTIIGSGADTASMISATPKFTGHGLCSANPYVQGIHAKAPFHPTASGEFAIALTDIRALHTAEQASAGAGLQKSQP